MIADPKVPSGYFVSAWVTGMALAMLIAGVYGAVQPLLGEDAGGRSRPNIADEVMIEAFDPPPAVKESIPEPTVTEPPDLEIPPLTIIQPPLHPPEMVEITPLEEPPPSKISKAPPPLKTVKTPAKPQPASSRSGTGSNAVTTFTGGGSGRFPSPTYPAMARAAKEQGTVKVLVTVEANGIPSTATVQSSSGSSALDAAARDHIIRRWRWPSGEVRRYLVPVQFLLLQR